MPAPIDPAHADRTLAMRLSLGVGVAMLLGKGFAYFLTGSAAILSDAAESVLHLATVVFAAISLRMSVRPARADSPYGFDRITFFSAGFEGGMIMVAALWIIAAAVQKWMAGLHIERLGLGTLLILGASAVNLALGWYLVRTGRRTRSIILEANGLHVLTDSWTSFGVVAGLGLVIVTGWLPFDPLIAIAVALNILWSGSKLVRMSFRGLMDLPDPDKASALERAAAKVGAELGAEYHRLRFRDTGQHVIASLHLLLPASHTLGEAHEVATRFEARLAEEVGFPLEVVSHVEPAEDHGRVHPDEPLGWI